MSDKELPQNAKDILRVNRAVYYCSGVSLLWLWGDVQLAKSENIFAPFGIAFRVGDNGFLTILLILNIVFLARLIWYNVHALWIKRYEYSIGSAEHYMFGPDENGDSPHSDEIAYINKIKEKINNLDAWKQIIIPVFFSSIMSITAIVWLCISI